MLNKHRYLFEELVKRDFDRKYNALIDFGETEAICDRYQAFMHGEIEL